MTNEEVSAVTTHFQQWAGNLGGLSFILSKSEAKLPSGIPHVKGLHGSRAGLATVYP